MRSTLFFIPHEIAGYPLFGVGIALAFLVLGCVAWAIWNSFKPTATQDQHWLGALPVWGIAAAIVVFVLPAVEQRWPDGSPIGLPIRGYGVLVLVGLVSGIGLSVRRGRQLGIDADTIIGLGFWMMLVGVVGARIFYVVQKWDEFQGPTLAAKLMSSLKLTEGGLVIYGGVVGGLVAALAYCWVKKLSVPATADLVAPGFLLGLCVGRIGCLLHGCCFGGVCTANLPAIQFPHGSGPYTAQVATGRLLGITTSSPSLPASVVAVRTGSPAEQAGIQVGSKLQSIQTFIETPDQDADPVQPPRILADVKLNDRQLTFPSSQLPAHSLPTHPSQIYSSLNALLLCGLIWFLQPLASRDGVVFCIAIMLYALSRFLLEGVRSDEAGQLGTGLTVAQLVALLSVVGGSIGMLLIYRLPRGRVWHWA